MASQGIMTQKNYNGSYYSEAFDIPANSQDVTIYVNMAQHFTDGDTALYLGLEVCKDPGNAPTTWEEQTGGWNNGGVYDERHHEWAEPVLGWSPGNPANPVAWRGRAKVITQGQLAFNVTVDVI